MPYYYVLIGKVIGYCVFVKLGNYCTSWSVKGCLLECKELLSYSYRKYCPKMCDKALEIEINGVKLEGDDNRVILMNEMCAEVVKFLGENIERIQIDPIHLAIKKKFIIRRLLSNVMWRSEIFDKDDTGDVLVHVNNLSQAADHIPYNGFMWRDFIVPSFQNFFSVDLNMFPTEEHFHDFFTEGVSNSTIVLPLIFVHTCRYC